MPNLVETYNNMLKEAQANQPNPEEMEKVAFLEKVAAQADQLLADEYGDDYNASDVEELAGYIIDALAEQEKTAELETAEEDMAREKVAELLEMGAIIAQGFKTELARD